MPFIPADDRDKHEVRVDSKVFHLTGGLHCKEHSCGHRRARGQKFCFKHREPRSRHHDRKPVQYQEV